MSISIDVCTIYRDRAPILGVNGWAWCTPMKSSTSSVTRSTCRVTTRPANANSADGLWNTLPPSLKLGKSAWWLEPLDWKQSENQWRTGGWGNFWPFSKNTKKKCHNHQNKLWSCGRNRRVSYWLTRPLAKKRKAWKKTSKDRSLRLWRERRPPRYFHCIFGASYLSNQMTTTTTTTTAAAQPIVVLRTRFDLSIRPLTNRMNFWETNKLIWFQASVTCRGVPFTNGKCRHRLEKHVGCWLKKKNQRRRKLSWLWRLPASKFH